MNTIILLIIKIIETLPINNNLALHRIPVKPRPRGKGE